MRFRAGYYIHTTAKDCFIEVLKSQFQDSKRFKGRVRWWALGYTGNPWVLRWNDPIEISADQFKNWKHFNPDSDWKQFRKDQLDQMLSKKS